MDNLTREQIEKRREALKKDLQNFIADAEKRISAFQGAIAVLDDLLGGPGPEKPGEENK